MKIISSGTMQYVDHLRREINKLYASPVSIFKHQDTESPEIDKETAETDN